MTPIPAIAISPHKIILVRLKWGEMRLDVLSSKEVNFNPRDTQTRGVPEKSGANHHDTIGKHLQSSGVFVYDQTRHSDNRKVGRMISTQRPGALQTFHTVNSGSLYTEQDSPNIGFHSILKTKYRTVTKLNNALGAAWFPARDI